MLAIDPNTDERLTQPQYDHTRPRIWHFMRLPGQVILRHVAVLEDGEDLTENPPTHELSWDEWAAGHERYGLNLDGQPTSGEAQ